MPLGPYKDFAACVTAMQNKGHSVDSAKKICGAMEQNMMGSSAVPKITEQFTNAENNKFFVKAFLLDDSVNLNNWAVDPKSIPKNIYSFIGKPLVLNENFDHPGEEIDTLDHTLAHQESFRIGNIIDITSSKNQSTGSTAYHAIIEVTNDALKEALQNNEVPLYVSPGIAEPLASALAPSNNSNSIRNGGNQLLEQPARLVSNWTGLHLAIVDQPAFTIKKATINQTCGGDEKGCLLQLRKAHLAKFGPANCGFCVKKALNTLQILWKARTNQSLTSQDSFTHNKVRDGEKRMSQLETINNNPQNTSNNDTSNNNNNNTIENTEQKEREQLRQLAQQQRPTQQRQAVQYANTNNNTPLDMVQENEKLRQELDLYKIKDDEKSSAIETLTARIEKMEKEDRREKISKIITADVEKDDKARLERINRLTASSIPIQEIEELVRPIKIMLKKASVNRSAASRAPYYGSSVTSLGSGSVASSSNNNNSVQIDEETGLSQLAKELAVIEGGI